MSSVASRGRLFWGNEKERGSVVCPAAWALSPLGKHRRLLVGQSHPNPHIAGPAAHLSWRTTTDQESSIKGGTAAASAGFGSSEGSACIAPAQRPALLSPPLKCSAAAAAASRDYGCTGWGSCGNRGSDGGGGGSGGSPSALSPSPRGRHNKWHDSRLRPACGGRSSWTLAAPGSSLGPVGSGGARVRSRSAAGGGGPRSDWAGAT